MDVVIIVLKLNSENKYKISTSYFESLSNIFVEPQLETRKYFQLERFSRKLMKSGWNI